jgi:hypothetical protein
LHYVDNALEQEDPFEDEEDLVLPLRPECFAVAQQGEIVQHLLHDLQAEAPSWVVPWLQHDRTETERHALEALTTPWACPVAATVAAPG